jgi:hypothetical protein
LSGASDPNLGVMSELDRLVRRLRGLSARAWQTGGRAEVVRRLAADLAAIGAPGRTLPDLPDHALADVVAVLAADAQDVDPHRTAELITAALAATR